MVIQCEWHNTMKEISKRYSALMSAKPWKDSADPDLFVLGYLSQDSTWHILRGHSLLYLSTFCSLNLY